MATKQYLVQMGSELDLHQNKESVHPHSYPVKHTWPEIFQVKNNTILWKTLENLNAIRQKWSHTTPEYNEAKDLTSVSAK